MARQTFFSFRYKNDCWRAGIIRNSWVTQERRAAGFFDSAAWEEVKKKGDVAIAGWIDRQLEGTSVTVVLIGSDTYGKKWIEYEIKRSHERGNGILGIYVDGVKNASGQTSTRGANPFSKWTFKRGGAEISIPVYDWVSDNGYANMGGWIESAARAAGK